MIHDEPRRMSAATWRGIPSDDRRNVIYAALKFLKGGSREMLERYIPDDARRAEIVEHVRGLWQQGARH